MLFGKLSFFTALAVFTGNSIISRVIDVNTRADRRRNMDASGGNKKKAKEELRTMEGAPGRLQGVLLQPGAD